LESHQLRCREALSTLPHSLMLEEKFSCATSVERGRHPSVRPRHNRPAPRHRDSARAHRGPSFSPCVHRLPQLEYPASTSRPSMSLVVRHSMPPTSSTLARSSTVVDRRSSAGARFYSVGRHTQYENSNPGNARSATTKSSRRPLRRAGRVRQFDHRTSSFVARSRSRVPASRSGP